MMRKMLCSVFGILVGVLFLGGTNASSFLFEMGQGSTVAVRGTSNVSGFTCRSTAVVAQGAIWASVQESPALVAFSGAPMQVVVSSIDCGNALMNKDLRSTLKEKNYPAIRFFLQVLKFLPGSTRSDGKCMLLVEVAGKKRQVEVPFTYELTNQAMVLKGTVPLAFSQFGLVPPERAGGLITVSEQFSVDFSLRFVPLAQE
jgi:hypothetical protein